MTSIHQFNIKGINGETIDFAQFEGKKILIVNTASECGFTSQYQQLQELYDQSKEKIVIVGFPANNFGGQEPGSNQEIKDFCELKYGVNFPLTEKISVIGDDQHPIYQWLTQKSLNGVSDFEVKWNFHKFLINESGHLVTSYPSNVGPLDEAILNQVQ